MFVYMGLRVRFKGDRRYFGRGFGRAERVGQDKREAEEGYL